MEKEKPCVFSTPPLLPISKVRPDEKLDASWSVEPLSMTTAPPAPLTVPRQASPATIRVPPETCVPPV